MTASLMLRKLGSYPVGMAIAMKRVIPRSALRVVPNCAHGPAFSEAAAVVLGVSYDPDTQGVQSHFR